METNNINIGIGGEAGAGIMEAGALIAKSVLRLGLYPFVTSEYPSLIKGGHNFTYIRIHSLPLSASSNSLDLLIALDEKTIEIHRPALHQGSAIIYDSKFTIPEDKKLADIQYYPIPMSAIIEEIKATPIIRNSTALGAVFSLLGIKLDILQKEFNEAFSEKGGDILETNNKASKLGYFSLKKNLSSPFNYTLSPQEVNPKNIFINGNDAICIGALRAGVQFVSIYPMTPATSILEFMAKYEVQYNLIVKEPEDEIAAINQSIGASFAGARVLTATSGGGYCLMTEAISLAGMSETPLVVIEAMRGGPSTGLPTKTEQADLRFVLHSGHGDFPKVVVAPGDPGECFQEIFRAFNIAEIYQLPVIILTDKNLAGSTQVINIPENASWPITRGEIVKESKSNNFARYKETDNGVSPRALPGSKGLVFKASSDEHDEFGFVTEEPATRNIMMRKRMKKIESLATDLPEPVLYGPQEADLTIFSWGSNKGAILEAIALLETENIKVNLLQILYIQPFPSYFVATVFDKAKNTLIVENNYTGQLAGIIREKTGRNIKNKLLRYDGLHFVASDIVAKVKEIVPPPATPVAAAGDPRFIPINVKVGGV